MNAVNGGRIVVAAAADAVNQASLTNGRSATVDLMPSIYTYIFLYHMQK